MSAFINSFRNGFLAGSSTIGAWVGHAMGPIATANIVRPVAHFALKNCYGSPQGLIGKAVEKVLVESVVSAALPYAPALGSAVGGFAGGALAAGTIYAGEKAIAKTVSCYTAYQNTRIAKALEGKITTADDVEDNWVIVAKHASSLAQDVI